MATIFEQITGKNNTTSSIFDEITTPKSMANAKFVYESRKKDRNEAENKLWNTFKENNVVVDKGSSVFNPTTSNSAWANNQLLENKYETAKKLPLNSSKAVELLKDATENQKKFNELVKTDEIKNQQKDIANKYNETAKAYVDYQNKKLEEDEIGLWDKTIGNVTRNLIPFQQFTGELAVSDKGDLYYTPTYKDLKNQKVLNSFDNSFWGTAGKIGVGALQEGGKLITSAALNSVLPGLGTSEYFTDMYINQYNNAVAEGNKSDNALVYATLGTAAEVITGKILGGTSQAIFGGSSELSQTISKGLSRVIKNHPRIVNAISNAISEGSEEFIQEFVDRFNRNIALGEKGKVFSKEVLDDALYSAAVGALTGAAAGGFDNTNYSKEGKTEVAIPNNQNINANIEENIAQNIKENANIANNIEQAQNIQNNQDSSISDLEADIEELRKKRAMVQDERKQAKYTEKIDKLEQQLKEVSKNVENIQQNQEKTNLPGIEKYNINNQVDNAISNNQSNTKNYLGKVTSFIANKIQQITGIDVTNRKHVLTDNDIRHMIKQHGDPIAEAEKGQIAITPNDIKNIPDIISNPTDIVKGTDNKLGQTIRYIKNYNDNLTYVVEVVPDKGNSLTIKTMWKKPSALANSQMTPSSTSMTQGSDVSSTSFNSRTDGKLQLRPTSSLTKDNTTNLPKSKVSSNNSNIQESKNNSKNLPKNPTKESSYDNTPTTQQVRRAKIAEYKDKASKYTQNTINWKDIALIKQKVNTMKRNLRAIMPLKEANAIYEEYFAPISEHNAQIEKEITKYNNKIERLNLSNKESTAVQMLGELKYNPDTTLKSDEVYKFIRNNNLNETKINNAVEEFRKIYDDLFTKVNQVLKEQGYKEIEYRKGYFPHFNEEHGKTMIGKIAEKLGWKFNSNKLPTDIAGITDQFLPGKKWTTFTQQRKGDITEYNVLKGFDNYVRGAMQLIYHTEDIQKLRGLENQIRYQHSEKGIQEKIDNITNDENLSTEEKQDQIDLAFKDYNNELANFVTNLRDYTNNLAGKKSILDRSAEQAIGRKVYNVMDNVSSRVSANMVGGNLSSAITNFIPITQAWSQVKTKNMLKGMLQTITNQTKSDNFVDRSTYLTNRKNQADRLYKTGLQKFSEKATAIFEAIDGFTSETIVRGKYLENIENGMTEQQAMKNANEFAKDVMAGRSQGDMPTIFNSKSPVTRLFTAFQLEVNNQYGYMFKDLPIDLKDKALGNLAMAFFKMFLGAWLYNKVGEKLTGRKSAFSPFDIAEETIKNATNENLTDYEKIESTTKSIAQELPFISGILGGGRLPIQGALPYGDPLSTILNTGSDISTVFGNDDSKKATALKNLQKEWEKPFYYVVLPFGGGQLKKTKEGLSMYDKNLPVAGSYTASGNLRFTADESTGGKAKAALFGQYANKEAQKYIDSSYKTVSKNNIQELKDLGLPSSEYVKYRKELNNAGTTNEDKINYIVNSNYTDKQKNIMAKNILKKDFNVNEYKKYNSYNEYNYAQNNPEKYSVISQIASYDKYTKYKDELKKIRDNTTNDKVETINYINSLNMSVPQKAMFIKQYYKSFNNYNEQIAKYINNKNISKKEKEAILNQLGFTIRDGKVYW
ncbi:MAG: hypothetical protein LIR50_07190 [Bacillota bacterium]|nr:hypothetical protein [Bacillota bacterium]